MGILKPLLLSSFASFSESVPSSWLNKLEKKYISNQHKHPRLETRSSALRTLSVTLRLHPLDFETGWTGELWSNCVLLILETEENSLFSSKIFFFKNIYIFLKVIFEFFFEIFVFLKQAGLESSGRIASS